jgi:hypothetical protein
MVNNLMRNPAIVLQDIEISGTTSLGNLLCNGLYKIGQPFILRRLVPGTLGATQNPVM